MSIKKNYMSLIQLLLHFQSKLGSHEAMDYLAIIWKNVMLNGDARSENYKLGRGLRIPEEGEERKGLHESV